MKRAAFGNVILSCIVFLFVINHEAAFAEDVAIQDGSVDAETLDRDNDVSWKTYFLAISQRILGDEGAENGGIAPELRDVLGFDSALKATEEVYMRLKSSSHDAVLDALLEYYRRYREISRTSSGFDGNDFFLSLQEDETLSIEMKTAIMQTLLPLLMRHSIQIGDLVAARKYRETWRSYERLWPDRRLNIQCQYGDKGVKFGILSLESGYRLMGETVTPAPGVCSDEDAEHRECLPAGAYSPVCYSLLERGNYAVFSEQFEEGLLEALAALVVKDNALTAGTVGELNDLLKVLHHRYKFNASWNRHWDHAKWEQWLSELHVISLILLEQHRFAELSRLERNIQAAFHGATFYQRLMRQDSSQSEMSLAFRREFSRLLSEHDGMYSWVKRQFSAKNVKKLNKSFTSWTKKGAAAVVLPRRLIVAWTLWSEGQYAQAVSYAGDVAAQKSRLVHPQLHSFDVMLRAVSGKMLSREDLETYVRVIHLKSPWLAYQTLSECARWLTKSEREMVSDVMRLYSPGDASLEAARFYREYETELRSGMDARHLCQVDSWLETELRRTESSTAAHSRRLRWLKDLLDVGDHAGMGRLSDLSLADLDDETVLSFWRAVRCHAEHNGESCPSTDLLVECDVDGVEGDAWIRRVLSCSGV